MLIQFPSWLPSPFPEANFLRTSPVLTPRVLLEARPHLLHTNSSPFCWVPATTSWYRQFLIPRLWPSAYLVSFLSFPNLSQFSPMRCSKNFPKEPNPTASPVSPSHFLNLEASTPNQTPGIAEKDLQGRTNRQIYHWEKNTQTDWLMTLENSISNVRMSSIRSVFPSWRPKKKSF